MNPSVLTPEVQRLLDLATIIVALVGTIFTVAAPFWAKAKIAALNAQKQIHEAEAALKVEQSKKAAAQPVLTIEDITGPIVKQLIEQSAQTAQSQQTMVQILRDTVTQIETRSSQITDLTAQNTKLSNDVECLRRDLKVSQQCVDDLQQQLVALKRSTDEALAQAKNQYTSSLQEIQNQLSTRDKELAEARQVIKQQREELGKVEKLEERIKRLEAEVEQLQQDRKQLISERDEAVAEKQRLETALAEKEQELAALRDEKEGLVRGMREQIERLQDQVGQQATTIAKLSAPPPLFEIVDDSPEES